jgi:hypothetical protein
MSSYVSSPALDLHAAAGPRRPAGRTPSWLVPAIKLLLAGLNLAALLVTAWSLDERSPPPVPPGLVAPLALPAAPALPEPLAAGGAWAAGETLPRLEDRLDVVEREIEDLVDAVMALRGDAALLAEDGQLAHERLQALEARGVRHRPGSAP